MERFFIKEKLNKTNLEKDEKRRYLEEYSKKLVEFNEIRDKLEEGRQKIRDHAKNLYKSTEKYYNSKMEELKTTKEEDERRFKNDLNIIEKRQINFKLFVFRILTAEEKVRNKQMIIKTKMRENLASQLLEKRKNKEFVAQEKLKEIN